MADGGVSLLGKCQPSNMGENTALRAECLLSFVVHKMGILLPISLISWRIK